MKNLEAFADQLAATAGTAGHLIVGPQGEILSHTVPNAEALAAFVSLCGQSCALLKTEITSTGFSHLVFHRTSNEKFLVVPMGNHIVGLFQQPHAMTSDVLTRVLAQRDAHTSLPQ